MTLKKKTEQAIKLLQVFAKDKTVEVCFSGGKDSEVILELAKMSGINYRAIYRNTTIDPPGTIAHCKSKGVEIAPPKEKFFEIVKKHGMPTRRVRFCCSLLKEYKILDYAVQGIRRCESAARAKRYKEPTICRVYGSKACSVEVCLPILDWSDKDVEEFIKSRGIKCHPLYYDEQGKFQVRRRLGCVGCPMQADNGVGDFQARQKLFKRLVDCVKVWYDTHPNISSRKKFGSVYNLVYHNLFCKTYDDYLTKTQRNLFGEDFDAKRYLEKYFRIKL